MSRYYGDDKVTGRTWKEFVNNIDNTTRYTVDSVSREYPDQWIVLFDDEGVLYDAEVTDYGSRYQDRYQLMLYNVQNPQEYSWDPGPPVYSCDSNSDSNPDSVQSSIDADTKYSVELEFHTDLQGILDQIKSIDYDYMNILEAYEDIGGEVSDDLIQVSDDMSNAVSHLDIFLNNGGDVYSCDTPIQSNQIIESTEDSGYELDFQADLINLKNILDGFIDAAKLFCDDYFGDDRTAKVDEALDFVNRAISKLDRIEQKPALLDTVYPRDEFPEFY